MYRDIQNNVLSCFQMMGGSRWCSSPIHTHTMASPWPWFKDLCSTDYSLPSSFWAWECVDKGKSMAAVHDAILQNPLVHSTPLERYLSILVGYVSILKCVYALLKNVSFSSLINVGSSNPPFRTVMFRTPLQLM